MRAADADTEFKVRILKSAPMFSAAPADDLAELARVGKVVAVQRGKYLTKPGHEGQQVFVVQSGVGAELHVEAGDDRAILIALHGAGAVAGLVSALASPLPAQENGAEERKAAGRRIEALSNMSVFAAPAADFLRICRRNSDLAIALAETLAARHNDLAHTYAQSTTHSLEMRLAAFFSQVTALSVTEDWNPVTNIGRLSQSAIAAMLGVSREHVNRTLSMWERSGLIFQNKKGDILVQNAQRLASLTTARGDHGAQDKQDDWLWEIDAHLDRGLNQTALHLALEASKRAPRDLRYVHRAVLANARLGAISEALALIDKHKLGRDLGDEEEACLKPRLLRDLAFAHEPSSPDLKHLTASAKEYEKVFQKTRGFYPGVNAAAGYAMIGERDKSKTIATAVAEILAKTADEDDDNANYWRRTTLAECKLLEGDATAAASLFESAANAEDATPGKKATTRKQLKRLGKSVGVDDAWIDRATPQSSVMFFSGPLAREGDKALPADDLLAKLDDLLAGRSVGWAYGALASGADIIIAEALIEAGVDLNVYLPLPPAEFLKASVMIGGPSWRDRFINCMRAASSIEWNRRANVPCNATYQLGAEVAMGKAIRHALQLETEAVGFFASQNGKDESTSLSLANAALWKARGLPFVEAKGAWPSYPSTPLESGDAALLFALILQDTGGAKLPKSLVSAGQFHLRDAEAGLDLIMFDSFDAAMGEAEPFAASAAAGAWSCWLDAGVFTKKALERSPGEAAAQLVTGACRPITDPGKVFASEPFACAAPLMPSVEANFEYVGFVPTREKLDPCAMYLVQF